MKRNNLHRHAGRGVQMEIVPDATLLKEELKVTMEDTCTIYSISKDIDYSIHEV
jgi:hypothetical protein